MKYPMMVLNTRTDIRTTAKKKACEFVLLAFMSHFRRQFCHFATSREQPRTQQLLLVVLVPEMFIVYRELKVGFKFSINTARILRD